MPRVLPSCTCGGHYKPLASVPAAFLDEENHAASTIWPTGASHLMQCSNCGRLELWEGDAHVETEAVDPADLPPPEQPV